MKKILISFCGLFLFSLISCDKREAYDLSAPEPISKIGIKERDGENITMSNSSENAVSYFWDFGDGFHSTEKEPTHFFELPGEWKIHFAAFSDGYIKAAIDSINVTVLGETGKASDFVGIYEGKIQLVDGPIFDFTDTTTLVPGENAILFGNLLKTNRLTYMSWGYAANHTTNDRAKLVFQDSGIISIPLQYMYQIDGFGYIDDVYIEGRGKYNAKTGALSLEYIESFLGDGIIWNGKDITEKVIIARKK